MQSIGLAEQAGTSPSRQLFHGQPMKSSFRFRQRREDFLAKYHKRRTGGRTTHWGGAQSPANSRTLRLQEKRPVSGPLRRIAISAYSIVTGGPTHRVPTGQRSLRIDSTVISSFCHSCPLLGENHESDALGMAGRQQYLSLF